MNYTESVNGEAIINTPGMVGSHSAEHYLRLFSKFVALFRNLKINAYIFSIHSAMLTQNGMTHDAVNNVTVTDSLHKI